MHMSPTYAPLIVFLLGVLLFMVPWPAKVARLNTLGCIGVWLGLAFLLAQAVVHDVRPLHG